MSSFNQDFTNIMQAFTELEKEFGKYNTNEEEIDKEMLNSFFSEMLQEVEQKEQVDKVLKELFKESQWKENTREAVSEVMKEQKHKKEEYKRLKKQYREEYKQQQEEKLTEAIDDVLFEIQEKEDELKWKRYKKSTTKRLKTAVALLTTVALMLSIGFAWYSQYNKHVDTNKLQIMTPYTLYLLNSGATDALELNVGGIHPGETKQFVVCVSSHDAMQEQLSKDGSFPYSLELVYTENIGLDYSLYPLTVTTADDDDKFTSYYTVVENGEVQQKAAYFTIGEKLTRSPIDYTSEYVAQMYSQHIDKLAEIVNKGQYDVYTGDDFKLSLKDETLRYNYYLVEIGWDMNQDAVSKETDLVYLVAKAGVPKPVEIIEAN